MAKVHMTLVSAARLSKSVALLTLQAVGSLRCLKKDGDSMPLDAEPYKINRVKFGGVASATHPSAVVCFAASASAGQPKVTRRNSLPIKTLCRLCGDTIGTSHTFTL